uniref:Uncharacterized protein n=1 Tax=Pithovirus LCDPAC02 TaxID=2506601 RepID=A0A481YQ23_9VIRU|nr:MAG: uncharacterized protein LCDPAC02_00640 [Pithovirus LCDPAC02]
MSIYYGSIKCQALYKSGKNKGKQCKNNAYWEDIDSTNIDKKYFCGVHLKKNRKKLSKDPNAGRKKQEEINKIFSDSEKVAEENRENGVKGELIVRKMFMMKKINYEMDNSVITHLPVFPNNRHQNRKDGFGCCSLSPMKLGPVLYSRQIYLGGKIETLNDSKNIENFHQGSKIFEHEIGYDCEDDDYEYYTLNEIDNYKLSEDFMFVFIDNIKHQLVYSPDTIFDMNGFYQDDVPHRHKYSKKELKQISKSGNINIPLFSLFFDINGKEVRLSYLQCRYIYCHWYEKLVLGFEDKYKVELYDGKNFYKDEVTDIYEKNDDFIELQEKLENGYNLCIYGFDGRPVRSSYEKSSSEDFVDGYPVDNSEGTDDFYSVDNSEGTDDGRTIDNLEENLDIYECYLDISKPFGHELVLYSLLTIKNSKDYPWNIFRSNNEDLYKNLFF